MKYTCPLCGSPLSDKHYHKVIKIQEKEEKARQSELERQRKQIAVATAAAAAAKRREQETRAKAKQNIEIAKKETLLKERKKSEIRNKRMISRIKKLEEEKMMMQKHTSPQEIGLADEIVLVKRLQKEFQNDQIEHTGKGGDVLHYVKPLWKKPFLTQNAPIRIYLRR